MSTKNFQKSANTTHELSLEHPGIINSHDFADHFELHCYEPPVDLRPFVVHIWVQRQRKTYSLKRKPIEILSGPNTYIFFTPEEAFVHGITSHEFNYNSITPEVTAGIKFRPGGFRAFLEATTPIPAADTTPLESLFPECTKSFQNALQNQSDEEIVATLATLLRSKHPEESRALDLITRILDKLDADTSLQTVREVAHIFGMSERSVQLLFQTHVGVGLKWVITRKRLLRTIEETYRLPTRHAWTEIAAEQGYNSQSHFSREFKEVIGQSPSQYFNEVKEYAKRLGILPATPKK